MITRYKDGIVQPRIHPSLLLAHAEPKSVKQALQDSKWHTAMTGEFNALQRNNTWTLVPLPPNRNAIGCKCVFRVKENSDSSVKKYKARLVAMGSDQKFGFDFHETFYPVIKPVTIRLILTLAINHKWPLQQLGVNNAFLNGFQEEEVYMTQPPGFESSDKSLVCKLQKAIYGLKQAPRAWFERLKSTLLQFGFTDSKCDPSLYKTSSTIIYILVYVDDIIITGNSSSLVEKLIQKLNATFSLEQLGSLDYFLGIEVHSLSSGALLMTHFTYIRDLLTRTNMLEAKPISSPLVSICKLSNHGSDLLQEASFYRSVLKHFSI